MKKNLLLLFYVILFFNLLNGQNKKKQIENLSRDKDSLEMVIRNNNLSAENNLLKAQNEIIKRKASYDSLIIVLLKCQSN